MMNIHVKSVFCRRFPLTIFRQHFPNDVRDEKGVATGVATDSLSQIRVEILNMFQINRNGKLEKDLLC
jgi:hypothetical protein